MLKVWVGLEARSFLQASVETVSTSALNYEKVLTVFRSNVVSSQTSFHRTYKPHDIDSGCIDMNQAHAFMSSKSSVTIT
jgi:hypothetical protein